MRAALTSGNGGPDTLMSDELSPWDETYKRPEAKTVSRTFTEKRSGKKLTLTLRELGTLEAFQASDLYQEYVERYVEQRDPLMGADGATFPASKGVFQLIAMLETMQVNEPKRTMLDWLAIADRLKPLWNEVVRWLAEFAPQVTDEGNSPRSDQATDADTGRSSD